MISGLAAGLAGMVSCGFYKAAAINTGDGYELQVIASAVVGGQPVGRPGDGIGGVAGDAGAGADQQWDRDIGGDQSVGGGDTGGAGGFRS